MFRETFKTCSRYLYDLFEYKLMYRKLYLDLQGLLHVIAAILKHSIAYFK